MNRFFAHKTTPASWLTPRDTSKLVDSKGTPASWLTPKVILSLLLAALLAACSPVELTATPVVVTSTQFVPTNTPFSPITTTSVPSLTATAEAPCDPVQVDFCITAGHFILQRPIEPPGNDRVEPTYRYGSTQNGTREPHHGVEFMNESGTPVYAAARGTVLFAGPDTEAIYAPWPNFYGNLVVLQHEGGLFTLYAHLSKIDVQAGQEVFTSDKLGEVGRTGVAIGSHLHFEVRQGNAQDYFAARNPELWLVPPKAPDGSPLGALTISILDEDHNPLKYAELTVRYYLDRSQRHVKSYYGTTYAPETFYRQENAALGELAAGDYRIAVKANGKVYERWVEVQSGELTEVVFVVK